MKAVLLLAGAAVLGAIGLRYVPQPALEATSGRLAVSPSGRYAYILGGLDNRTKLTILRRDPGTGNLSHPACVRPWFVHTTRCLSAPGLNNSLALAVSRDDTVAIAAYASGQLALLRPDGAVRACFGESVARFRCVRARGLAGANDVAFSPDGRNLYVAARQDDPGLLVLSWNPASGKVAQLAAEDGCVQRAGRSQPEQPPCASVPSEAFTPAKVRIAFDGRTVLVLSRAATQGDGIFVFHRATGTGSLGFLSCYVERPRTPCEPLDTIEGAEDLLFTPDDRHVITAGRGATLTVLDLDPSTGVLERQSCVSGSVAGCGRAHVPTYGTLALSPTRRLLFSGSSTQIRGFGVAGNGTLTELRGVCAAENRQVGCVHLPKRFCCDVTSLALSPDGRWLYADAAPGQIALRVDG